MTAIDRMVCSKRFEAFEIALVLIAAAAASLASFVYWAVLDQNGASLILSGTASLLAILMHGVRKEKFD